MFITRSTFLFLPLILVVFVTSSCANSEKEKNTEVKMKNLITNGYTNKTSYSSKDSITIFLNTLQTVKDYELEILTINGEKVHTVYTSIFPQEIDSNKLYEKGFGYKENIKIAVPNLKSGIYLIEGKIPFIIKPNQQYDVIVLYSSNTENAYCNQGGKSTYAYNSSDRIPATTVSFERPISLPKHSSEFLRWLEKDSGYDIGYICDQDLDDYHNIANAELLIIPGHSEYWTKKARQNFDRFVAQGKNALILSGNSMWWQVRYNQSGNQMICHRVKEEDSIENASLQTILWNDSSLNYPILESIGLDFDYGGYGKKGRSWGGYKIVSNASPIFKGVDLSVNDTLHLPTDEYDGANLIFSDDSLSVSLNNRYNFYQYELIGYDLAKRKEHSNGAWIMMQKKPSSGIIINTGSTNWCKSEGMLEKDADKIKQLTLNMMDLLLNNPSSIFQKN